MRESLPDHEEQRLSERYDAGERDGGHARERDLLQFYSQIRRRLRAMPSPEFDRADLAARLAEDIQSPARHAGSEGFPGWPVRVRAWLSGVFDGMSGPAYGGLCASLLVLCAIAFGTLLWRPGPGPVSSISFLNKTENASVRLPWVSMQRLQGGGAVDLPADCGAELLLSDGSIVSCSPAAKIAVAMGEKRHVELLSGAITVAAASDSKRPFVVDTALGRITVTGTVFRVQVVPME